ncbi:UNKNOWN [Stylonychia lemnae]|uniref:Uncharacterized protein n=1 Tax=Stylonychia lemnae TaxID=5949 RepID=A0A077ZVX2_STYLE|nr:UNKNOWN [Stylonychia lemnae]|eukprot:CDW74100.1 UNKNOWN [Stylonychia lemnae]
MEGSPNKPSKFKFCYIMQGLPGSGKSTVARQLAGENGKIFQLDKTIVERKKSLVDQDIKTLSDIYESIFQDFCQEMQKGTEIIVIDNTNLSEWEYIRFVKKAQLEHFFVSIVALPPPDEIQTAVERSQFDVNDDQMTQMLAKWEPFSPQRLLDKTHKMHNQGIDPHLTHAAAYHKMSSDVNHNKRNSFVNPPDVIAENVVEEEQQ